MDISKLVNRFSSKKIKPIATIVIFEVMLFLFSIESLIEWFHIHPILFFVFLFVSSFIVFTVIQYIKDPEENRSWRNSALQLTVLNRTGIAIVVFFVLFILYVICIVPNYRVIAITEYRKNQFNSTEENILRYYSNPDTLKELSFEIQTLIGEQYTVKVDNTVKPGEENSRLIIVPGIFQNEKAVETLIKLEERIEFFIKSKEESEIPKLYTLWRRILGKFKMKKERPTIEDIKKQIGFMSSHSNANNISWISHQWNKFKFMLNF